MYIANANEMRLIDAGCIKEKNIPSLSLMERAGLSVFEEIAKNYSPKDSCLVVVSKGNNGADGLVVARLLKNAGYTVAYNLVGGMEGASEEFLVQKSIVDAMKIPHTNDIEGFKFIVDAIFGIGLSKTIKGEYSSIIHTINANYKDVIAVDLPSGLDASTGEVLGVAVKASMTVTFGLLKVGLLLNEAIFHVGELVVKDIGFLDEIIEEVAPKVITYTKEDLYLLPRRFAKTHKGSYGTVMVVAGAYAQAGAAYLSAKAAYKVGAGLVKFYVDECNRTILQTLLPEAVMGCYEGYDALALKNHLENVKSLVMGSGLKVRDEAKKMFEFCMQHFDGAFVLDADIINIVDKDNIDLIRDKQVILTPHIKEMKNLCKRLDFDFTNDFVSLANNFAKEYNITIVIKDFRTVVKSPDSPIYLNLSGNNCMAKGGSGDVLGGIIGGLLAQGLDSFTAASLGVYIHGLCGEEARKYKNEYSVLANDLIDGLDTYLQ